MFLKVIYFAMQSWNQKHGAASQKYERVLYVLIGPFWDEIKPRWLVKMETIEGILRASTPNK